MKHKLTIIAVVVLAFLTLNVYAISNQPKEAKETDEPPKRNLKILPQDISKEALKDTMKFFSNALGVKCGFCHVSSKDNPKELDFASDENHYKEAARFMMKMTTEINDKYFIPFAGPDGQQIVPNKINCMTCHNGNKEPITSHADSK
ncbi:MAG: c-type cytochrome [Bacteroidia bacterium]|nr:c-type cytochrome [Bacteroidia bacterium]MCO5253398.1 c-type cytochrome [Bacteroidota bacterium]